MISDSRQAADKIGMMMIVDDNAFDQRLYARVSNRSGLVDRLVQFTEPREAADYLLEETNPMPDLVLLDINMPGMDGFEFLEKMTRQLGEKMCPVFVMLTTSLNPADQQRASEYTIVRDFLNKPLTSQMLAHLAKITNS